MKFLCSAIILSICAVHLVVAQENQRWVQMTLLDGSQLNGKLIQHTNTATILVLSTGDTISVGEDQVLESRITRDKPGQRSTLTPITVVLKDNSILKGNLIGETPNLILMEFLNNKRLEIRKEDILRYSGTDKEQFGNSLMPQRKYVTYVLNEGTKAGGYLLSENEKTVILEIITGDVITIQKDWILNN